MALQVVGVGLGRTGTNSLKVALEQLLGGPCYHMFELIANPRRVPLWERAVRGEEVDWAELFDGYAATVDWPGCAFWREIAAANPEAPVLLSTRESSQTWWASMERTIVPALQGPMLSEHPELVRGQAMVRELFRTRFTPDFADREAAIAEYERHCDDVRREVPAKRLIEWQPRDGWEPICSCLGVPVPEVPFPHENSREDFDGKVARSIAQSERELDA
ncbi:MAG TPA: sulfotransferase [Solirubrobacteraceae bacterium]|nr:sulfotransferase [Solirubrobacteraceae bacterium]